MEIRPNSAQIDDDVNADEKHDIYSILYGQSLTDNFSSAPQFSNFKS